MLMKLSDQNNVVVNTSPSHSAGLCGLNSDGDQPAILFCNIFSVLLTDSWDSLLEGSHDSSGSRFSFVK
jgi:hypothetical protein